MDFIDSIANLEDLYGTASEASLVKVATRLSLAYRRWIAKSRFCVLTTVGPEGTDSSPRGSDGPVVEVVNETTLMLPDWRGNNRIDSLRNIVRDGRLSLLFFVPGSTNVVRMNGKGRLTADAALLARFARPDGKIPRSVTVITISEVYFQCARAVMRARLWTSGDQSEDLPTAGDMLAEMTNGAFDGKGYDIYWPNRAAKTTW